MKKSFATCTDATHNHNTNGTHNAATCMDASHNHGGHHNGGGHH